jgi:hypothetical protein
MQIVIITIFDPVIYNQFFNDTVGIAELRGEECKNKTSAVVASFQRGTDARQLDDRIIQIALGFGTLALGVTAVMFLSSNITSTLHALASRCFPCHHDYVPPSLSLSVMQIDHVHLFYVLCSHENKNIKVH